MDILFGILSLLSMLVYKESKLSSSLIFQNYLAERNELAAPSLPTDALRISPKHALNAPILPGGRCARIPKDAGAGR